MNKIFNPAKARVACLSLGLSIALGACQPAAPDLAQAPLAGAKLGGAFQLVDQNGHSVTDKQWAGQYKIMYFGYTYCPDACPLDMQRLMAGFRRFEAEHPAAAAHVQPVFISIDPARDTPDRIKPWVAAFHPRLMGLTGTDAQIATVAKEYGAIYQRQKADVKGQYLMDHSRTAILYGPQGQPITLLSQDKDAPTIAAELATWVR